MSRLFVLSGGTAREMKVAECHAAAAQEGAFLWLHLDANSDDVDALLAAAADIPAPVAAALKAYETRPRGTQFGDGALVNLRGLGFSSQDDDGDTLVSIRIWAQRGLAVTLSYRPLTIFDRVVERMLAGAYRDPGDLIVGFVMQITDALDPDVAELGDDLDRIESCVFDEKQTGSRYRVATLRAEAISYRRFLTPQRQALERIMLMQASWLETSDRLHLQEAADRCARMAEELEAVRERAALVHEALTDLRAEHMNRQALILAVVALIFLPLTFITGLLGMNVEGIPFSRYPWAFWGVVLFCLGTGAAVAMWFKATHWLQE